MTKQDYRIVAGSINLARRANRTPEGLAALDYLETCLVEDLGANNPKFLPEAFSRACRRGEGEG